jgi:glycosylphosphatidylinositol transamidase (GPIT) subunit GPI8
MDQYNFKDVHSSVGMTPSVVNKSNENLVLRKLFKQSSKEKKPKIQFEVGDRVRIKKLNTLLVTNLTVRLTFTHSVGTKSKFQGLMWERLVDSVKKTLLL